MQQVYDFLKAAGTYFLATSEDSQARVRPFGTINLYNKRLYFMTNKMKAVSHQLHQNPRLEICTLYDGRWLRLEATAVEDNSMDAKIDMLTAYPELAPAFPVDSENTELWFLRNVNAVFYSFDGPPEQIKF